MHDLRDSIREFAKERDWEQFHSPKNLTMALTVEAGELLEHFQWLTDEQSRHLDEPTLAAVGREIGDVLIYLVRLADTLDIDPLNEAKKKLELNRDKYPVERVRGRAKKYGDYPEFENS